MTDVTAELLPDHPIAKLVATTTNTEWGIHNGEVVAYRCVECGVADEDVRELVHERGCTLAGETAPHGYEGRRETAAFPEHDADDTAEAGADPDRWLATDGGQ